VFVIIQRHTLVFAQDLRQVLTSGTRAFQVSLGSSLGWSKSLWKLVDGFIWR